jgi:RNA 2',3'-cyclic 3'-phosphodiesterase
VRWVPPHQWHVTLRFLGEVDEDAAVAAVSTLAAPRATAAIGPRVSRLGRDVVCLPVTGLDDLATAVLAATTDLGRPDGRPFVGHLTLARLRHRAACGLTGTPVDLVVPVDEVILVRSTLAPEGAVHEPVLTVPLR